MIGDLIEAELNQIDQSEVEEWTKEYELIKLELNDYLSYQLEDQDNWDDQLQEEIDMQAQAYHDQNANIGVCALCQSGWVRKHVNE